MRNSPPISRNQPPYLDELLKLRNMALTWHRFMEVPTDEERSFWDNRTASYVEELERILENLNMQALEALWLQGKDGVGE